MMRGRENNRHHRGFTLIELVLLILVLGILAVLALPRYLAVSGDAELTARDGAVGAVRAGIAMYKAKEMIATGEEGAYPAQLDDVGVNTQCSPRTPCFSTVLIHPIRDGRWNKVDASTYSFTSGAEVTTYHYNSDKGTFEK